MRLRNGVIVCVLLSETQRDALSKAVPFLSGIKNKFEAHVELGITRASVLNTWETLPPKHECVQSTVSFGRQPAPENVYRSWLAFFMEWVGRWRLCSSSGYEPQNVIGVCYVTR